MIIIVGVGALGSNVALALRSRAEELVFVDFDRVESKNTLSQFHARSSIGQNKAQALAKAFLGLFDRRATTAISHKLTSDNVEAVIIARKPALVVDCTDNFEARDLIQRACLRSQIPALHASVSVDGTFGRVMWAESFVADRERPGVATCEDGAHLPFYSMLAGVTAQTVKTFLDQKRKDSFHVGLTFLDRM